jgi:hypothetical protein
MHGSDEEYMLGPDGKARKEDHWEDLDVGGLILKWILQDGVAQDKN